MAKEPIVYHGMPICDLHYLTQVEAISQIEEIYGIALLILPKNISPEATAAWAAMPKRDIASTVYVDANANVHTCNGVVELSDNDFVMPNTVCIINGFVFAHNLSPDTKGTLIINGMLILHESLRGTFPLEINSLNGISAFADFDELKPYGETLYLDAETVGYFKPKTYIIVGDKLSVAPDVTAQMLQEKQIGIIVGGKIVCPAAIAPYFRATATAGKGIFLPEEDAEEEKDE